MKRFSSTFAFPAVVFFLAVPAHAFTEDVCYPATGGITECTPLPAVCMPAGTDSPACREAAALEFTTSNQKYPDARSTVHVDVPYIMAQAIGFSATDAYWIAAYSEATDRGSFEPRDESGALVGGGALKTASVTGLQRTDFTSGGVLIHFSAPRNLTSPAPVVGIDGLDPDTTDADHEVILAHLRAWAMAGSGAARPDCAGGLTNASATGDNALGTTCYSTPAGPATINGSVTLFDGPRQGDPDADTKDFSVLTGFQIIQDSDAGTATSDTFDAVVGGDTAHVADARLGVYMHALGDRISHHVCLDDGYLFGPDDAGTTWEANMTSSECAQGLHSLRHIWENGIDFTLLAAQDRTTISYLGKAYDELVAFATARGVLSAGASDAAKRAAMIADLTNAIETADVVGRLAALRVATCARGLAPFPGEAACAPLSDGGNGDAGAIARDAGSPVNDAGSGDGATNAGAGDDSGGCSVAGSDEDALSASMLFGAIAIVAWGARRGRRGT